MKKIEFAIKYRFISVIQSLILVTVSKYHLVLIILCSLIMWLIDASFLINKKMFCSIEDNILEEMLEELRRQPAKELKEMYHDVFCNILNAKDKAQNDDEIEALSCDILIAYCIRCVLYKMIIPKKRIYPLQPQTKAKKQ